MSDSSDKTTVQQDISGALADAMVRAGKAKAILITMAMEDESVYNFSAGSLVEKLGLIKAVELRAKELWGEDKPLDDDTDE